MSRFFENSKPQDPEAQRGSPASRLCPGVRSCWPPLSVMASHFSLVHLTPFTLGRRISLWLILGLRTAVQILVLLMGHLNPGEWIANLVIGIISFFVVMYSLYLIDIRCERGGTIKCVFHWNYMHFGIFCYLAAALSLLLLVGHFLHLTTIATSTLWLLMWIAIVGVGWIASWTPEGIQ